MSREDYRKKIEAHRQTIPVDESNSRRTRSRAQTKKKGKKRRDPLMTSLLVIFIFIPLVMLVYVWKFYEPKPPIQAQGNDETIEYETNVPNDNKVVIEDDKEEKDNDLEQSNEENMDNELDSNHNSDKQNESKVEEQEKVITPTENASDESSKEPKVNSQKGYTVKSGDTLYRIANSNGTTVDAIMQANGLNSTNIHVGQTLIIP